MSVPHVILRMLMDGPSHGYRIRKDLALLRHFYPLNNVNVYPLLRDLEESGLVVSRTEVARSRARKVYEITAAGAEAFQKWLTAAPDGDSVVQFDPVSLRLVLALDENDADLSWLEQCVRDLDAEIEQARAVLDERRNSMSRLARLAVEHRIASYVDRREYLLEAFRITRGETGA